MLMTELEAKIFQTRETISRLEFSLTKISDSEKQATINKIMHFEMVLLQLQLKQSQQVIEFILQHNKFKRKFLAYLLADNAYFISQPDDNLAKFQHWHYDSNLNCFYCSCHTDCINYRLFLDGTLEIFEANTLLRSFSGITSYKKLVKALQDDCLTELAKLKVKVS